MSDSDSYSVLLVTAVVSEEQRRSTTCRTIDVVTFKPRCFLLCSETNLDSILRGTLLLVLLIFASKQSLAMASLAVVSEALVTAVTAPPTKSAMATVR